MKKMMIIAVLIGGMLMPAQIMARNDKGYKKPKVEYRNERKDKKDRNDFERKKPGYKKYDNNKYGKKRQNKPDVIVVNRPAPRPLPPPPPEKVKVIYKNEPFNAVASLVGFAALLNIIAD